MKLELNKIKNILIIQYEPWGDVLVNTALFPAIRKKFPEAQIEYLVRKPFHKVLSKNTFLDDVIIFENKKGWQYYYNRIKLINYIRQRKFDLVIDQMRGSGSAQIVFFSGAKYKLGLKHRRWNFVYNLKAVVTSVRYSASMKFDLLKPLGIIEQPYKLHFHISESSHDYIEQWIEKVELKEQNFICFSPGSPVKRKKWNLNNYAELADLIISKINYKVVFLWGPEEKEDIKIIKEEMFNEPIVAPPTDFNQAAAMLQASTLLVCNDGGINHLSAAVSTPSLAIFGSTSPKKWCPTNLGIHHYLHNPNVNSRIDDTFGISAEEAFEKIKLMIGLD
ncbi:MAG: glycosyltransferase family 9 protein [Ignavibacteriae bacterium]|nr:glycosyltransferase family 9 protein [Ignavibacteriota bacterium]